MTDLDLTATTYRRQAVKPGQSPHGTKNRYDTYGCRCPDCRAFNARRSAARRAKAADKPFEVINHGTITGYFCDRCRCEACGTAARNYQRDYRRRKREGKS